MTTRDGALRPCELVHAVGHAAENVTVTSACVAVVRSDGAAPSKPRFTETRSGKSGNSDSQDSGSKHSSHKKDKSSSSSSHKKESKDKHRSHSKSDRNHGSKSRSHSKDDKGHSKDGKGHSKSGENSRSSSRHDVDRSGSNRCATSMSVACSPRAMGIAFKHGVLCRLVRASNNYTSERISRPVQPEGGYPQPDPFSAYIAAQSRGKRQCC